MAHPSDWRDLIDLEPSPAAPKQAREAIASHLASAGVADEAMEDLQIALSEAVANAVENGVGSPTHRISIRHRRSNQELEVGIHTPLDGWETDAPGMPLVEGPHDGATVAAMRIRIIRRLVHRVAVSKTVSGTFVILTILLALDKP